MLESLDRALELRHEQTQPARIVGRSAREALGRDTPERLDRAAETPGEGVRRVRLFARPEADPCRGERGGGTA